MFIWWVFADFCGINEMISSWIKKNNGQKQFNVNFFAVSLEASEIMGRVKRHLTG